MVKLLHEIVSEGASKRPDKRALIEADTGNSVTYGELDKRVRALAGYLSHKGLNKGDRMGLLSRNSISFVIFYFAICRAGAAAVPLNHTLSASSIEGMADDCGISALYAADEANEKVAYIKKKVDSIKFTIRREEHSDEKRADIKLKEGDLSSIIYTSGTTRKPLGVMLSHKNIISNNRSIMKFMRLTAKDRVSCVLPFYYIYGLSLLFSHLLAGGTLIIDNRFMYPGVVLDAIGKYGATGFAGVSSHYAILLKRSDIKKRRLSSLRRLMQAGDKMSPNITRQLAEIFPDKELYIMYGQTEASPRLTYLNPRLVKRKPGSAGKAIPGVEVRVVTKGKRECGKNEAGEIIARGENVMLGYWKDEKETKKAIKDGWLYTGDIAFKDEAGDLFIVGRKKDFIKVGAHRVSPLEVEGVVMEHPGVMEAAAAGVDDEILGRKIKVFITLAPGRKVSLKEVIDFCKERLPGYKVPSAISVLDSMPRNSFGKIDKDLLRSR